MRNYRLWVSLGALLFIGNALSAPPLHRLIEVEDGDTLVVEVKGETRRLQLLGIDAPENVKNPKFERDLTRTGLNPSALLGLGQASAAHLRNLLPVGTSITLEGNLNSRDKYGRTPIVARVGKGQSINAAMIGGGYAITLVRYPLENDFKQKLLTLEIKAQSAQRGLWGDQSEAMRAWSGK